MPNPRQHNIPVDKQEGAELQRRKDLYEQATGQTGDWGKALGILTLGGLAALGIYALVKATQPTPTTWQVTCPNATCRAIFPIATTGTPPRLAQVVCPYCHTEMVVDFDSAQKNRTYGVDGNSSLTPGAIVDLHCHYCQQLIRLQFPHGTAPITGEFRCPLCGGIAEYGIGEVV